MGIIHLLDNSVRELIAAGEVVERPASVVKELVENALDALADSVTVELRQNGIRSITVTDNGKGIEESDIKTAFLRHATSKIRDASDLEAIGSLGFRGEALAAIAAVSRVQMITRPAGAEMGFCYILEGGEPQSFSPCGAPVGTSIRVSDLFFNTPARMKFLKKDVAEGNAVEQLLWHMALTEPDVAFRLLREDKLALKTSGQGLYAAIYDLYPRAIAQNMRPFSFQSEQGVRVDGYVSDPQDAKPSRSLQHISVNGRYVKSRAIQAAAEEACRGFLMQGRYPAFALQILLPLTDVDVNVHPAKTEIRFRSERAVTAAVYHAVRAAMEQLSAQPVLPKGAVQSGEMGSSRLSEQSREPAAAAEWTQLAESAAGAAPQPGQWDPFVPAGQLPAWQTARPAAERGAAESAPDEPLPDLPLFAQLPAEAENLGSASPLSGALRQGLPHYTAGPADPAAGEAGQGASAGTAADETSVNASQLHSAQLSFPDDAAQPVQLSLEKPPLFRVIGELFATYILCEFGDQLLLIDQHAAHERLLFEQLRAAEGPVDSQLLLQPLILTLTPAQQTALLENAETLEKLGFSVEPMGAREVAVREIPTYLPQRAAETAVLEIAESLLSGRQADYEARRWLMHSVACRAAIKAGHRAEREEMLRLAAAILEGSCPKFCPHGRPVYITLSRAELEKRFGRQG